MHKITSQTRLDSYEQVLPGLFDRRMETFYAVKSFPEGATAEEVAAKMGKPTYWIRPRLTELLEAGQVIVIGKKVSPFTGKKIGVWKVA